MTLPPRAIDVSFQLFEIPIQMIQCVLLDIVRVLAKFLVIGQSGLPAAFGQTSGAE